MARAEDNASREDRAWAALDAYFRMLASIDPPILEPLPASLAPIAWEVDASRVFSFDPKQRPLFFRGLADACALRITGTAFDLLRMMSDPNAELARSSIRFVGDPERLADLVSVLGRAQSALS